jgi:hypothetical protein
MPTDKRCEADAKIFSDDYLVLAKYEYMRPLLMERSYYAMTISKGDAQIRLIALDTNCLDSPAQQSWFTWEVANTKSPIIVFGHIPPIDYTVKGGFPWDKVGGWESMKSYFINPKIVLWIFGHVHDYEHRSASGKTATWLTTAGAGTSTMRILESPPVMLISGGGGAPLEPVSKFTWQPATWAAPVVQTVYNQVRIQVTATSVNVTTRATPEMSVPFHVIDSFTIPLGGAK